ncbi:UNVERIFIED_CONTAM: hypothetical protein Scaly_2543600 [Sesamum calycinum]|uniref:Reverse transcriptase domain-containing protein n=1 Tax=Sesamum calycinum TaxID=2727403 RepID=A0AAW2J6R3_9LAMI
MSWLILGDFNYVNSPMEKQLGVLPTWYELKDSVDCCLALGFHDAQTTGCYYTWAVTPAEVKTAVLQISDNKAPGLDSYTSCFFRKTWNIVGDLVCKVVMDFFRSRRMLRQLNHTIIALVSKFRHSPLIAYYRPISRSNVIYKVIIKIIANRLSPALEHLIDSSQAAFFGGRNITNNIFLAQEMVRRYSRKLISPRCTMNIDLLRHLIRSHGRFSPEYSTVALNGSLHGFFSGKEGLRQGDPMSLALVLLCMEFFSCLIKRNTSNSDFNFHPKCEKLRLPTSSLPMILYCFSRRPSIYPYFDGASPRVQGHFWVYLRGASLWDWQPKKGDSHPFDDLMRFEIESSLISGLQMQQFGIWRSGPTVRDLRHPKPISTSGRNLQENLGKLQFGRHSYRLSTHSFCDLNYGKSWQRDRLIFLQQDPSFSLCINSNESAKQLFFECPFSDYVWSHIRQWLDITRCMSILLGVVKWLKKGKTGFSMLNKAWYLTLACTVYSLWRHQNEIIFECTNLNPEGLVIFIKITVYRLILTLFPQEV